MSDFKKLPVICSIGGINSAGRTSNEMSYKRMVFNNLDSEIKKERFYLSYQNKAW